jgi:hypothetical protein
MPQGRSSTLLHSLLCLKTGHRYNYKYLDAGLSFNIMPQGRSSTLLHSLLCLKAGHQHLVKWNGWDTVSGMEETETSTVLY